MVLSPRADDPLAVLKLPVVLFARAAAPVAVFLATSGVADECSKTTRGIKVAGSISLERTITSGRIGFAGSIELKCKRTEDAVAMASGIVSERKRQMHSCRIRRRTQGLRCC